MRHLTSFFLAALAALSLTGCGRAPALPEATVPRLTEAETLPPETVPPATEAPEEALLDSLTLREKVGQLFLIRPEDLVPGSGPATSLTEDMVRALDAYPVGGFVQFSQNITGPQQLLDFNNQLYQALSIPPFLAVDEEGGLVTRLAGAPGFQLPVYQSAAAAARQAGGPQEMGRTIGGYLREYGFNMDFAPVADVNTNPNNPVIGTRAFSSDPGEAAVCARGMADGLLQAGIIPVFKHFPGHGDTREDSHQQLAVSQRTLDQLRTCELLPFRDVQNSECIMAGHIALPQVTGDMTPASLSPALITGLLREELGFQGLIITDSLSMGAIQNTWSSGEAALLALKAGCDLLLMPQSLPDAFEGVLEAVESGRYPEDQLDETVLRILRFKLDHHMLPQ